MISDSGQCDTCGRLSLHYTRTQAHTCAHTPFFSFSSFHPVESEINLNYSYRFGPYRAVNTPRHKVSLFYPADAQLDFSKRMS